MAGRHEIAQPGTRNSALLRLVGEAVHKFGREVAKTLAARQHELFRANIRSSLEEHFADFDKAWAGMVAKLEKELTANEREKLNALGSENQRDAFRIARSFSALAERKGEEDFPLAQASLASRLGDVTDRGAGEIIQRLCEIGIIVRTQPPHPHRSAARYRWAATSTKLPAVEKPPASLIPLDARECRLAGSAA